MKLALKLISILFAAAATFAIGFSWRDLSHGRLPEPDAMKRLLSSKARKEKLTSTQIFKQAYNKIQADFYKPVDSRELTYAGLGGLMASLGDPHTQFFEPKVASEFSLETKGNFVGVGARLQPDPSGAKVHKVFKDGPAARAGLKDGDLIISVDGVGVSGEQVDDIVSKIRGKEGTMVRLTVLRASSPKPMTLTIRRATIVTPTAEGSVLEGTKVGYVAVSQFTENTTAQFDNALDELESKDVNGLIIDLRGNPGGLLETAVDMLSRFVEDKTVVKMRMRGGHEEVARTYSGVKRTFPYPIMVLINEESASAAEIFSGVMRDYKLATLVGEHSYGKASVQNVFPTFNGSSAKITVARYYLPLGDDIGRKVDDDGMFLSGGLKPDVKVELGMGPEVVIGDPKTDSQLAKALEMIRIKQGENSKAKIGGQAKVCSFGTRDA